MLVVGITGPRGFAQTDDVSRLALPLSLETVRRRKSSTVEQRGSRISIGRLLTVIVQLRTTPRRNDRQEIEKKLDRKVEQIEQNYVINGSSIFIEHVELRNQTKIDVCDIFTVTIYGGLWTGKSDRRSEFSGSHLFNSPNTCPVETQENLEMLAASICREVYFTVLPSTAMASRVPRCLFGQPSSRETMEMLQEALDAERSKFARRWGVDPCSEDKENNYQRRTNEQRNELTSNKKRSNPYSRQTSIHDYWRARKICDANKKPLTSSADVSKQQNVESSKVTKTMTTTTTTMTTAAKTTKKMASN